MSILSNAGINFEEFYDYCQRVNYLNKRKND